MVVWKNLTGHLVKVYIGKRPMVIYPEKGIARLVSKIVSKRWVDGIPIVVDEYVELVGLPKPKEGVMYIVSTPVLNYLKEKGICRKDVVAPDTGPGSVVKVKVKGGRKKVGVRRFRGVC